MRTQPHQKRKSRPISSHKRKRLESKGWQIGDAKDFLSLSPSESNYVELKVILSSFLLEKRKQKQLTQIEMASIIKSSQSRVAKMEKGEASVSLDLIFRTLFSLGTDLNELAIVLRGR